MSIVESLLYLFTFLMPFTYLGAIEIGFTIKSSEVAIGIAFLAWVWGRAGDRRLGIRGFKGTAVDWPLFILLAVFAFSITQVVNLERAVAYFGWTVFSVLAIFYLLVNAADAKILSNLLRIFLFTSALASLFAVYQVIGDIVGLPAGLKTAYDHTAGFGFPRAHSTMLEPLYFGNYLLAITPLAAAFLISGAKGLVKDHYLVIALFLNFLAVFLTYSRGTWLALLGAIGLIGLLLFRSLKRRRVFLLLLVMILAFAVFQGFEKGGRYLLELRGASAGGITFVERLGGFTEHSESRFINWDAAWRLFKDSPILGVGIGNFGPKFEGKDQGIGGFPIVNNMYLEILVETGILGLLSYLAVLGVTIQQAFKSVFILSNAKRQRFWQVALVGILAAFLGTLIQQMTYSTLNITHFWFLLASLHIIPKISSKS